MFQSMDLLYRMLQFFKVYFLTYTTCRLRASLLECFYRNKHGMLMTFFEDILKKDPTCCYSMAKVICMHQNGRVARDLVLTWLWFEWENSYHPFAFCFQLSVIVCMCRIGCAGLRKTIILIAWWKTGFCPIPLSRILVLAQLLLNFIAF